MASKHYLPPGQSASRGDRGMSGSLTKVFLVSLAIFSVSVSAAFATNQMTGPGASGEVSRLLIDVSSGGTVPTGTWWSITGGDTNIEVVTYTTGRDRHAQKRTGQ